jgi:hypothetical protein
MTAKTIAQTLPTKPTIRKCFVCSAKIVPGILLLKEPKAKAARGPKVSVTSISCKSACIPLYTSRTRKILGAKDARNSPCNILTNQNPLPNGEINATNKLLGYENERKTH